jgi:enamine deaminase RidA (YjgF/YER057c/UK114 family)
VTRRLATGGPWEGPVGYSRAVAAGDFVFVSGCTSVADGQVVHEGDPRAQTAQAIANVAAALTPLGAGLADVVATRMFVTDIARSAEYGRAHGGLRRGAAGQLDARDHRADRSADARRGRGRRVQAGNR